jgi:hypothetical protein
MSWLSRWFGTRPGGAAARPRPSARLQLETLEDRSVPTVFYFGGNLLPHVETQAVYYGSEWSSVPATGAQPTPAAQDAFLKDITGSAYMTALTNAGYGVGTGSDLTGAIDNISLASNSVISDASIQARLQADIKIGLVQQPDANRLYIVYVQPNVAVNLSFGQGTTQQGIVGYHGAFGGTNSAGQAVTIHYAVIAYPGGTVGNSSLNLGTSPKDQLTAVTSHELAEAVTDPDVLYSTLSWYDPILGEIGDVTENNPNAYVRLDGYLVQEVADQNDNLLSISGSVSGGTGSTDSTTSTTMTVGPVSYHYFYATVRLTIKVSPSSGSTLPTGTVDLMYGGSVLGSANLQLVNGVEEAIFNVAFFANGDYNFTAQYVGNSQFQGSTSNSVTVVVGPAEAQSASKVSEARSASEAPSSRNQSPWYTLGGWLWPGPTHPGRQPRPNNYVGPQSVVS